MSDMTDCFKQPMHILIRHKYFHTCQSMPGLSLMMASWTCESKYMGL